MKRRSFLSLEPLGKASVASQSANPFRNQTLPKRAAISAGIEPYTGEWDDKQKLHLLRRCLPGVSREDFFQLKEKNLKQSVDFLLQPSADRGHPRVWEDRGIKEKLAVGEEWYDKPTYGPDTYIPWNRSLDIWWSGNIMESDTRLLEKMVLFWHNHLPVGDSGPKQSYAYVRLLRKYAYGNFRKMMKDITLNLAMMDYLNGDGNTKKRPNENYARELLELFTIGKGPQLGPGDYTNYTEDDVKAATMVLTGWKAKRTEDGVQLMQPVAEFFEKNHDTSDKQFSHAFGNKIIKGRSGPTGGEEEIDELLDMIFSQKETARFMCRNLYRFFVYYVIDENVEKTVIDPLADILYNNNYEMKSVLSALFNSAHFHHPHNVGCVIKNHIEVFLGTVRQFGIKAYDNSDTVNTYTLWNKLLWGLNKIEMKYFETPDVAGWPAWYQAPSYHQLWLSSYTFPLRDTYARTFLEKNGKKVNEQWYKADYIAIAQSCSNPSNLNKLIDELSLWALGVMITSEQKNKLKQVLLDGLPDFEWSIEWNKFATNPDDVEQKLAVASRLEAFFLEMISMAEFQLS